jgi:hypothetical protein
MNGKFVVSESVHFDSGEIRYVHQVYDSEQEYLEKMRELYGYQENLEQKDNHYGYDEG